MIRNCRGNGEARKHRPPSLTFSQLSACYRRISRILQQGGRSRRQFHNNKDEAAGTSQQQDVVPAHTLKEDADLGLHHTHLTGVAGRIPRLAAHDTVHNRTVNIKGGPNSNLSWDRAVELFNQELLRMPEPAKKRKDSIIPKKACGCWIHSVNEAWTKDICNKPDHKKKNKAELIREYLSYLNSLNFLRKVPGRKLYKDINYTHVISIKKPDEFVKTLKELCDKDVSRQMNERENDVLESLYGADDGLIHSILTAWKEVTVRCLCAAWRPLWPECVLQRDFEGFEELEEEAVVHEIVSLGNSMGLEVDDDDVEELVEEHSKELSTEELLELHKEENETLKRSLTSEESGEEEDKEESRIIPAKDLKDAFFCWSKLSKLAEDYHPDVGSVQKAITVVSALNAVCEDGSRLAPLKDQTLEKVHAAVTRDTEYAAMRDCPLVPESIQSPETAPTAMLRIRGALKPAAPATPQ
ncbi:Tigger transposable element-derived protein 1-like 162 [Homarus americanus]|uniref:Tigger transposable element-derived protein 1-like 162 n=1 Tax=Homarus americanus TaxID=6706 RepID=A0A8J5MT91_HOMAM|nr:Tigger transposable element-derived protein 1-like 162 [Homarus americanus]